MKRILISLIVGIIATGAWAAEVDWQKSYADALAKAKKEKKLVLVDVYTDWCGWCKKLDKDTYSDKDVQAKLAKDFVAVKVNPETSDEGKKLQEQFSIRGFPYLLFVDGDGKKVAEIVGYKPAAAFLTRLEEITKPAPAK